MPARGGLGADPAGAEVGLRAGAVFAADVDADAAEGRFGPGRHRLGRGGAAGVEAEAGEDRAADRGGAGGRAAAPWAARRRASGGRRWRAGERRGARERGRAAAGQLAAGGDHDRPAPAEDRPGRAALFGRGRRRGRRRGGRAARRCASRARPGSPGSPRGTWTARPAKWTVRAPAASARAAPSRRREGGEQQQGAQEEMAGDVCRVRRSQAQGLNGSRAPKLLPRVIGKADCR